MTERKPFHVASAATLIVAVITSLAGIVFADEPATVSYFDTPLQTTLVDFVQPADDIDDLSALAELEQLLSAPVIVPTVVSASRRPEKSTAAPATVIVIGKEDIRLRGYSQLIDVIRDLPGMEAIEFFRSEWGAQVPVRGISGNNKIVVLVNGMRVNPPGGENFPFHNDFSVRHAERVEVVYGSGSTLYGEDAISTVINVVTKEPENGTNVEFGAGTGINFEREAWGWYSGELGCCRDIKVSGYVQYHDSELTPLDTEYPTYWQDFRDVAVTKTNAGVGAGVVPDRSDYGLNVFGRVEWNDWSFQLWHRESEVNSAEGRPQVLGYVPQAKWRDYTTVMEGKHKSYLCNDVTLESNLSYSNYEIDPDTRFVFPRNANEWFLDDFKYGRGWRMGLDETLQWEPTENFTMIAGGVIRYSNIVPKSTFNGGGFDPSQGAVAQGGQFLFSDTVGGPLQSIPQVSRVDFWTYATYAECQWQACDRLRLVGGVRVTWDGHFNQVPVTPRASAIYNVSDRVTAKYIYNRGFVQPAPYFAFAPFDNGTLLSTVNPDVAPETAETHEINFTYNSENLMLGLAAYYGTQSNIITVAERAGPQNILGTVFRDGLAAQQRTLVQTANGGESERWGFDLYGTADCGSFRSWFSYSYVDFDEVNTGVITGLPGISKHNGRLGVTCQATCRLFITPSLVIRSTPANVVRGRLGSEIQDPWEINLYALYEYSENLELFLDLRNITDHHYALGGLTRNAFPQETFSGMAGFRLTY